MFAAIGRVTRVLGRAPVTLLDLLDPIAASRLRVRTKHYAAKERHARVLSTKLSFHSGGPSCRQTHESLFLYECTTPGIFPSPACLFRPLENAW